MRNFIYHANYISGTPATSKKRSNDYQPDRNNAFKGLTNFWIYVFLLLAGFSFKSNTVLAQAVPAGVVPVTVPNPKIGSGTGFAIDGDLNAYLPAVNPYQNVGDWLPDANGKGGILTATGAVPAGADIKRVIHASDNYGASDNIFKGGSKIDSDPNSVKWVISGPNPSKNDINNALVYISEDANGHIWAIMSGDRATKEGNSFLAFQFLQKSLVKNPNGSFTSSAAVGQGGRTEGDIQITAEFVNGGTVPNLYYESWQLVGTAYTWVTISSPPANAAYGSTNGSVLTNVPYNPFGGTSYDTNLFAEVAVDITEVYKNVPTTCIGKISTLWVVTKSSQSSSANMTDFVEPIPLDLRINITADAGPDKEYCAGSSATIGTAAVSGFTYSWAPATGLSATNVAQPTASPTSTTSYVVTVTKANSSCSTKDTVQVKVNPNPTITAPTIGAVCAGSGSASLSYTGVTNGANQYRIDWNAAAETAGLTDVVYTTLPASPVSISGIGSIAAGSYSGTIYVKNSTTTCESAGTGISLVINPNPTLSITNPTAVCSPNKVDLTAAGVTAGSTLPQGTLLTYFTNAGATIAVTDPTQVGAGTYYIKASSNTTPSCADIKAVTVMVNPTPSLSVHNPDGVCAPGTVSLTAAAVTAGSTLPAGTTLSYFESDGTTPVATPGAVGSGTYYIKATSNATPACSDMKSVTVSIKNKPDRPVVTITEATLCGTLSAPKLEVNCPVAGTYSLTQTGVQGTKTFVYTGANGPVVFENLVAGKGFSITLTIDGCTSDATNCDNKTNTCPVQSKVSNLPGAGSANPGEMKAFPVPFHDNVTVQFTSEKDENYVVNLYDIQGRLVKELKAGNAKAGEVTQIQVNGAGLYGNFYVVRKVSKSGVTSVKLLKE